MRLLGIDYGDRRIGLAISDELGLMAHGLPTLMNESDEQVLKHLEKIIADREVAGIVVGLPRNMDDSLGPQAQKAMDFAARLELLGKPVHFVDERLTTERARRVMDEAGLSWRQQRRKVDRMAAQFILQIYLDQARRRNTEEDGQ